MSRRDRRRLVAELKKQPVSPLTAIHEAGHAVARYVVADEMGIPQENVHRPYHHGAAHFFDTRWGDLGIAGGHLRPALFT